MTLHPARRQSNKTTSLLDAKSFPMYKSAENMRALRRPQTKRHSCAPAGHLEISLFAILQSIACRMVKFHAVLTRVAIVNPRLDHTAARTFDRTEESSSRLPSSYLGAKSKGRAMLEQLCPVDLTDSLVTSGGILPLSKCACPLGPSCAGP